MNPRSGALSLALEVTSACFVALGCGGSLDAGSNHLHGLLPVDERSPIVLSNDGGRDNWPGEYAAAFAAAGRLTLAGIIVGSSPYWPDIDVDLGAWRDMVAAARASNMAGVPDPVVSDRKRLVAPASGIVGDTIPNRSAGALLIVEIAHRLGRPQRPVVVATGSQLTDVADAYLVDPTIADLVVVVSSLGHATAVDMAVMDDPNGEIDPWADTIVASKLRYVQVSSYYDQKTVVPDARVPELPNDAFGLWMADKRASIMDLLAAADQLSVIAVAIPAFAQSVTRASISGTTAPASGRIVPTLAADPSGNAWIVAAGDSNLATSELWRVLASRR